MSGITKTSNPKHRASHIDYLMKPPTSVSITNAIIPSQVMPRCAFNTSVHRTGDGGKGRWCPIIPPGSTRFYVTIYRHRRLRVCVRWCRHTTFATVALYFRPSRVDAMQSIEWTHAEGRLISIQTNCLVEIAGRSGFWITPWEGGEWRACNLQRLRWVFESVRLNAQVLTVTRSPKD